VYNIFSKNFSNWYGLLKGSGKGIIPTMNNPIKEPYHKDKPGINDSSVGVTELLRPGSTGLGTDDTSTKGPKGRIGIFPDHERSKMHDFHSSYDGGDKGGSSWDTKRPSMRGGSGWYDTATNDMSNALGRSNDTLNDISDNPDNDSRQISNMTNTFSENVFDELRKKRKNKTNLFI